MKKFVALFLSLTLFVSIGTPVFAYEDTKTEEFTLANDNEAVSITCDDGNVMEFKIYNSEIGSIMMDYYYNGEFVCSYDLTGYSDGVLATTASGSKYIVDSCLVEEIETFEYNPSAKVYNERNLGTVFYKPAYGFTNPAVTVSEGTINSKLSTQKITSKENEAFSDIYADLVSVLISHAIVAVVPAPASALGAIAQALLTSMISSAGGSVVGVLVNVALSDTYEIVILNKQIKASGNGRTYAYPFSVIYSETDGMMYMENDYYSDEDVTPANWSGTRNAEMYWDETYGFNSYNIFPGIKEIIFYDD